jgi:hypothetical protein
MICISLVIHAIHRSLLASTPTSPSVRVATSRVVTISFRFESPIPIFWLRRSKNFLPVLWWSASIRIDDVDLHVWDVEICYALSTFAIFGGL